MRRRILFSTLLIGLVSITASAHADSVYGTRGGPLLVETRDLITLTVDHGHATFVVRRTFHNGFNKFEQADVTITDFPLGAVATGLRTQGTKNGQPIWYDGVLMEAEEAARKYLALTGIGGYYPKDPALLSWRHGELMLQVFPIDPGGSKTIEYTLEAPTKYAGGRDMIEVPSMGDDHARPIVTITAAHAGDTLFVGDGEVAKGTSFPLSDDDVSISLVRSPKDQPKLGGSYAGVFFGPKRALMHTSIEIPPKLSEIPREPWVVVALDASKSMSDTQREAEIVAARAYLTQLPDAHVLVMPFSHHATPRTSEFVSTKVALADLAKLTLLGENGSALDAALTEASARLNASATAGAPRRIVAMTDFRTRVAIQPKAFTAIATASHAVLHLATIEAGTASLARDDDQPWAAPARATGGLLWTATAPRDDKDLSHTASIYEEWARPLRIDRIEVRGVGLVGDALGVPTSMAEGEGFEDLRIASYAPPDLAIEGELWSTPLKTLLNSDDEQNRLWSALVFGSELLSQLTEPEMMTLAMKGHAVSPVTSFLAIEPGVRPSTEGFDEIGDTFGADGLGMTGIGYGGGGFGTGIGLGKLVVNPLAWLEKSLSPSLKTCGALGRTAKLRIETTSDEVVDARVASLSGPKDETMERCLEDAGWALDLPFDFDRTWAVYDVKLGAPAEP